MPLTERPDNVSAAACYTDRPTARPAILGDASGFWFGHTRRTAWLLTLGLIALIFIQIAFQFRMNIWSRDIFNALERKDGDAVSTQALIFVPLVVTMVGLAIVAVYGRMTIQREWRKWLTNELVGRWLANGHYYQLDLVTGDHQNPEGRIGDDARIATDAPVDFVVGMLSAAVTAVTFVSVLWVVGGDLTLGTPEVPIVIPGFLVIAAVIYAVITSTAVILVASRFVAVSERTNQSEAEFRYALTRVRKTARASRCSAERRKSEPDCGKASLRSSCDGAISAISICGTRSFSTPICWSRRWSRSFYARQNTWQAP